MIFFFSFNVKYPDTKLISPCDALNCMLNNYPLNFLSNFEKTVVIISIIPATSCSAERSFSVKTEKKLHSSICENWKHTLEVPGIKTVSVIWHYYVLNSLVANR